jgi:hypothetical protein
VYATETKANSLLQEQDNFYEEDKGIQSEVSNSSE